MRIELLGTGTSQGVPVICCDCKVCSSIDPRDKRLRCSVSIEHNGKSIIVDVGPDFRQQILRSKVSHIDMVLLTHEHNDHIIGLDDLRPFNFSQKKEMPLFSLERVLSEVKSKFYYAFTEQNYPGAPSYSLNEVKHGDQWSLGDINITAFEVMHGDLPILCYRFNDFVYITDAKRISPESLDIIRGCDTLIVNALRKESHWSHLTLDEALHLVEEVKPRKAYLTHLSHRFGKHEEIEAILPDNVRVCYDGLVLNV